MSLKVRLALLFALGTALVIGLGGALFVHELGQALRGSVRSSLQSRATTYLQRLGDQGGLNFQDPGSVKAPGSGQPSADLILQVLGPGRSVVDTTAAAGRAPLISSSELRRARAGDVYVERNLASAGGSTLLLATPATGSSLVLVIGAPLDASTGAVEEVVAALAIAGPIAVILAGLAAWILARASLAPVERMRAEAADISVHDSGSQLNVPATRDEMAALAVTMNDLLGRLQEALGRQRGFVTVAGHELRTPLSVLRMELELAGRPGRSTEDLRAAIASAAEETERIQVMAEDLLLLARSDEGASIARTREQALFPVLAQALDSQRGRAAERGVELALEAPASVVAPVDDSRIRQVVDNLVDNALRWAPRGTTIEVRLSVEGPAALLEVADHGPGFPPAFLPHAFDRFRRPDDARSRSDGGSGLGLAIVKAIAEAHGGAARAANRAQGGAVVSVELPLGGSRAGDGALPSPGPSDQEPAGTVRETPTPP